MEGSCQTSRITLLALVLIVASGLGLRLLPLLCHARCPALLMDCDSVEYHRIAVNLLSGHGYSAEPQAPFSPSFDRAPGLPLFLVVVYSIAGISVPTAIAIQALVSSAVVLLTYFIARALTRRTYLALIAAAVQALDPVAIQYSNLLLTETYTSLLVLLVTGCVLRYVASARARWLIAAGGGLALGILFHPVLLFLPLFVPVLPLLFPKLRQPRQLAFCIATVVLAYIPASARVVQNWQIGDLHDISSVASVNLLKYKAAGVEALLRDTTRAIERDRLTAECEAQLPPGATPGERFRLWQRRGVQVLLAHPLTYIAVHLQGAVVEMFGPERDHTTRLLYGTAVLTGDGHYDDASIAAVRRDKAVLWKEAARHAVLLWQVALAAAMLAGAWTIARSQPYLFLGLLFLPCYMLVLSGGPEASPRFRVLYLPAVSLLTAAGGQLALASVRTLIAKAVARRTPVLIPWNGDSSVRKPGHVSFGGPATSAAPRNTVNEVVADAQRTNAP